MKLALISDVHGNLAALEAVLEAIDREAPDRIFCLGDTVGYGPNPRECLRLVRERCAVVLAGNHEHAVLHGADNFTPLARSAIDWTAQQLRDPDVIRYLSTLVPIHDNGPWRFVHGSVKNPLFDYVRESDSPWMYYRLVRTLREEFVDFDLCFVGHNHRAFLGTEVGYLFPHEHPESQRTIFRVAGQKAYVSIGSVGQPRDGDWRSSWVLFNGETVEYRRVAYDRQRTMDLIRRVGLPEFLADRLAYGN